jgi:diguanylate cyclase (GGDEF)-like protein
MHLTSSPSGINKHPSAAGLLSPGWSIAVVIAALLLVFELDRRTGSAPVQHLYYLPIIFASFSFRARGGLMAALAAIILYHLANPHLFTFRYEHSDFVQIALFIAVSVVTSELTHDAHRLRRLAMTDDLTGLHNLRSFEARLAAIMRASCGSGTAVSMFVLDVDRLKTLNDKYGHLTGAEAVRTVGHIIAASLPPTAVACRYGGDEFVVVLPFCGASQAKHLADDLRRKVNAAAPVLAGRSFPKGTLSISIGLATRAVDRTVYQSGGPDDESGEALFRAADAALYLAKEAGRNQLVVA